MKDLIKKIVQISAIKASPIEGDKQLFLRGICEERLFMHWFNTFPNSIDLGDNIEVDEAVEHIISHYGNEIKDVFLNNYKGETISILYIRLYEDTVISISDGHYNSNVEICYRITPYEKIEKLVTAISRFEKMKKRIPRMSLIHRSRNGLSTVKLKINTPQLKIEDNYNDDFSLIHEIILHRLKQEDDKGLVLLHGKPGTGKTSYLRYLITQLEKDVIFLPPNMASIITDPGLIELLIENQNSIFVIEDAENILIDREAGGSSAVSALLNLTDGLLSDCLNIQIICTFNTDLSKLDRALLRKGRLIARYEFKELTVRKAQALSDKLGFNKKIEKPTTLTDIYNQNEESCDSRTTIQRQIGFKAS